MTKQDISIVLNISDLCNEIFSILPLIEDGQEMMCYEDTINRGSFLIAMVTENIEKRVSLISKKCDCFKNEVV